MNSLDKIALKNRQNSAMSKLIYDNLVMNVFYVTDFKLWDHDKREFFFKKYLVYIKKKYIGDTTITPTDYKIECLVWSTSQSRWREETIDNYKIDSFHNLNLATIEEIEEFNITELPTGFYSNRTGGKRRKSLKRMRK